VQQVLEEKGMDRMTVSYGMNEQEEIERGPDLENAANEKTIGVDPARVLVFFNQKSAYKEAAQYEEQIDPGPPPSGHLIGESVDERYSGFSLPEMGSHDHQDGNPADEIKFNAPGLTRN
jgi:hypothetical protein